ncbi:MULTISPECIES: MerR family transcriptional regulator [Micromonospora]|uniref:Transcriptional regulator, MerR family n=1 Tax=Micromonospora yangpuensis TaxID=683228 RepID=A0A1C6UPH7_9ACTN|nr:MerR family transcriptional regulator [Micromonospora yangpuensis]GGM08525.1 MerR family transcriptional regulator [Micromonospora yangpuensis]SCL55870.1 transcriptional regulator, MerR family [Micromonospora yangpuensis]
MRSGELARLAGVTVRALRHYHQVGVLAEPERGSNGYRSYDVHDLIRVVRIKRLASVGIPLERMPALLDDAAVDGGELLEVLAAELTGQIDRLTAQRDLVLRLRAQNAAPDLPPELAPFLAVFATAGLSPHLARLDRDQSVLLAHLVGVDGMPHLERFYQRISTSTAAPAVVDLARRFDRLGPDSTEPEVTAFVDSFVATVRPLLDELADGSVLHDLNGAAGLVDEYTTDVLNEQQRHALTSIAAVLDTPVSEDRT